MISTSRRSSSVLFRKILFCAGVVFGVSALTDTQATRTVLTETVKLFGHRSPQRQLEEASEVETDLEINPSIIADTFDDEANQEEANENATEYSPCDICQGLTFLEDKIPRPDNFPNATCGDANAFYQNPEYFVPAFLELPDNTTVNYPGTCRNQYWFNAFFEQCCRPSLPMYQCERNVKESFFDPLSGSYSNLDTATSPIVGADQSLNVSVHMTYQHLDELNEEAGTASLLLSFHLAWNDPRLKWDVNENKCANVIDVWTGYVPLETRIWIPDFDLTNDLKGIQETKEAKANVFSDGTVQLVKYGTFKAFCNFHGLGNIPFDTLGCQFHFGSYNRLYSDLINFVPWTPEYTWIGPFVADNYNEWQPVPELFEQGTDPITGELYYNFFFRRAKQHYVGNIIVPTILLTYVSFVGFLLDTRVGERLGFGMALALVIVAQQIVTSDLLPISSSFLWLDKIIQWSFYWVLAGLVESVAIGFLFYFREDSSNPKDAKEEANEEEMQPLSEESNEEKSEIKTRSICSHDFYMFLFYSCPLRTIDMLCLLFSIITYTIFLVVMFVTATQTKAWTRKEPHWFDESSSYSFLGTPYVNGDPNN